MIIIQVEGGLGNQMFQSALAYSFHHKGLAVKLDISKYDTQQSHNGYELERVFKTDLLPCSNTEKLWVKTFSKLRHKALGTPYKEKDAWQWNYHPAVNTITSGYLKGYWQCEKYFSAAAGFIREKFTFTEPSDEANKTVLDKINHCNAVSLHIRRGDYLSAGINASLPVQYYLEAIETMNRLVADPVYFIFSDDIAWAKQHIAVQEAVFIDWNKGQNSYLDMQLMSHCRHHIIANSSFSWWGAWLNNYSDKKVIAPTPWMPLHKETKDIIPAGWIPLQVSFANNALS